MFPSPDLSLHPAIMDLPIAVLVAVLIAAFAVGALVLARRGAGRRRVWGVAAALLAIVVVGARAGRATGEWTGRRPASTDVGVSEAVVPDTSVSAAATGRELEHLTDRAHARFAAGDRRAAARDLRDAARLLADAARAEAAGGAVSVLTASARELASLATAVEGGPAPSVRALDDALARARLADARMHYARVFPLVRNLHNGEAGIELLWVVDHLGRAMREGRLGAGGDTAAALDEARAAALRLTRPGLGVPASTGVVLERLGVALDLAMPRARPLGAGTLAAPARA